MQHFDLQQEISVQNTQSELCFILLYCFICGYYWFNSQRNKNPRLLVTHLLKNRPVVGGFWHSCPSKNVTPASTKHKSFTGPVNLAIWRYLCNVYERSSAPWRKVPKAHLPSMLGVVLRIWELQACY